MPSSCRRNTRAPPCCEENLHSRMHMSDRPLWNFPSGTRGIADSTPRMASCGIGTEVENFEADTQLGRLNFFTYISDQWTMLFSHPADFTPVCASVRGGPAARACSRGLRVALGARAGAQELQALAKLTPEFEKRNCKIVGLSVDDGARRARGVRACVRACALLRRRSCVRRRSVARGGGGACGGGVACGRVRARGIVRLDGTLPGWLAARGCLRARPAAGATEAPAIGRSGLAHGVFERPARVVGRVNQLPNRG